MEGNKALSYYQQLEQLRKEFLGKLDNIVERLFEDDFHAVKFIDIQKQTPNNGQACWVRHRNGAEYRMTYPFNHEDYPLWYPLPKD